MALSAFVRELSETHCVIGEMRGGGMKMLKNSESWTVMLYLPHSPRSEHSILKFCLASGHSHYSYTHFRVCLSVVLRNITASHSLSPLSHLNKVFSLMISHPHSSPVRELLLPLFTDRENWGSERRNGLPNFVQWTQDYNLRFLMPINTGHQHVHFFPFVAHGSFALPCPLEVRCGPMTYFGQWKVNRSAPQAEAFKDPNTIAKFPSFKVTSDVPGGRGSINLCPWMRATWSKVFIDSRWTQRVSEK